MEIDIQSPPVAFFLSASRREGKKVVKATTHIWWARSSSVCAWCAAPLSLSVITCHSGLYYSQQSPTTRGVWSSVTQRRRVCSVSVCQCPCISPPSRPAVYVVFVFLQLGCDSVFVCLWRDDGKLSLMPLPYLPRSHPFTFSRCRVQRLPYPQWEHNALCPRAIGAGALGRWGRYSNLWPSEVLAVKKRRGGVVEGCTGL